MQAPVSECRLQLVAMVISGRRAAPPEGGSGVRAAASAAAARRRVLNRDGPLQPWGLFKLRLELEGHEETKLSLTFATMRRQNCFQSAALAVAQTAPPILPCSA